MIERGANGKPQMSDYVVTYRYDVYETIRATSPEDARTKLLRSLSKIPGRRTAEVTNVEEA